MLKVADKDVKAVTITMHKELKETLLKELRENIITAIDNRES